MWARNTYWFDFAMLYGLLSLGSILFGRFEDWKPRWRRVLKVFIMTGVFFALLQFGGRQVAWGVIGALMLVVVYLHAVWLPSKGINGWTAEPRDKYLDLVGARNKT
ncbi:MAG TPA: hypothetical protein VJU15_06965 [Gemmatimonadales bacterium]|nr:hypothetical protein [Gemmatimonadales bacterium]